VIEKDSHLPIDPPSTRSFGLVVGTAFLCLGLHPIPFGREAWPWAIAIGLPLLILGLIAPNLLRVPNLFWFRLSLALGSLVANLLMVLVFVIIVTPTGILMRRIRSNYLDLNTETSLQTYWISRESDPITATSLRNQY